MKLDTYCIENNIQEIAFLKIDVEGGEKTRSFKYVKKS
jgi:hypothetical protein